jgi:hypothetical protein
MSSHAKKKQGDKGSHVLDLRVPKSEKEDKKEQAEYILIGH